MVNGRSSVHLTASLTDTAPTDGWSQTPGGMWLPTTPRSRKPHEQKPSLSEKASVDQSTPDGRPGPDDREGWKQYWEDQELPWRREPEIPKARQQELEQRRQTPMDIQRGIYPFGGMTLTRADIEWLLVTHENGKGLIDWSDKSQREREGIDIRGAQLSDVNLERLPLACMIGGSQLVDTKKESLRATAICLNQANLSYAQLSGAILEGAQLEGADLRDALLEDANLRGAWLKGANLSLAQLQRADLRGTHLEGADLSLTQLEDVILRGAWLKGANLSLAHLERADLLEAQLKRADLSLAKLQGANLRRAQLEWAVLQRAQLKRADLQRAQLKRADLRSAQLEEANLSSAQLQGVDLQRAHLEGACLSFAQLQGAVLRGAQLQGVDLRSAHLEGAYLTGAKLEDVDVSGASFASAQGVGPRMSDVSWGSTNLSVIDWSAMRMLGDEYDTHQKYDAYGKKKILTERLADYETARRASQQFSVALGDQGLTPDAARFAFRAKCLERTVLWYQLRTVAWQDQKTKKLTPKGIMASLARCLQIAPSWLFSWFLFLISGYGYRLRYCLFWYMLIIIAFTAAYCIVEPHYFTWWMALGESVNVFHGRGASPIISQLDHPARFAMLTVMEAWIGLVIEIVLVATALQRFFGK